MFNDQQRQELEFIITEVLDAYYANEDNRNVIVNDVLRHVYEKYNMQKISDDIEVLKDNHIRLMGASSSHLSRLGELERTSSDLLARMFNAEKRVIKTNNEIEQIKGTLINLTNRWLLSTMWLAILSVAVITLFLCLFFI